MQPQPSAPTRSGWVPYQDEHGNVSGYRGALLTRGRPVWLCDHRHWVNGTADALHCALRERWRRRQEMEAHRD